jgi:hypothetical protein
VRHRNAWAAAEIWLDGEPGRGILMARSTDLHGATLPGYVVELREPGRCTTGDDLELVDALAEAFDRREREQRESANTEPPPDTSRDALVDDTESLYSAERDCKEPDHA